jgi:hypothetical protein
MRFSRTFCGRFCASEFVGADICFVIARGRLCAAVLERVADAILARFLRWFCRHGFARAGISFVIASAAGSSTAVLPRFFERRKNQHCKVFLAILSLLQPFQRLSRHVADPLPVTRNNDPGTLELDGADLEAAW